MIAYFHFKLSVCVRVYNFQIIEWCSEPTIPGVTASQLEEGFDLCWMEMGSNHLPNSPAGDNLCLYTDIQTLDTFCTFLRSWFSAGDFESAGRVSVSKIAQAFQPHSKSFHPIGKSDKTATKKPILCQPQRGLIRSISRVWSVIDWLWWRSFVIHLGQRQLR